MNFITAIYQRIKLEIAYRKKLKQTKDQDPYIYK
jgi:hypothetical protein